MNVQRPSFPEALPVWTRIALSSFGGPAGQIAVMQRVLVDEKKWIGQQRFLHALNFCMLLPGPEAQQLATYIGWLLHRWRGAVAAGGLFVLPGFISILGLSYIYVIFDDSHVVDAIFFGIKPAVLAIVVHALIRIGRRALRTRLLVAIALIAFIAIFVFALPFPWIVIGAAATGLIAHRFQPAAVPSTLHDESRTRYVIDDIAADIEPPRLSHLFGTIVLWLTIWWAPVLLLLLLLGTSNVLVQEALFFSRAAVVTFGGAYAVLAYIAQQAVHVYGWLQPGEMLDGLGMAETTPGPLIQVVQFVGFMGAYRDPGMLHPLLAATIGAIVTTWVTFVPCFLWIMAGAPYVEMLRGKPALAAGLSAITAAVTGVILNLSLWFAIHTLFHATTTYSRFGMSLELPVLSSIDAGAALIALISFGVVFVLKRGLFATIGIAALAGLLWKLLLNSYFGP